MKYLNLMALSRRVSGNSLLTLFASIAFGSFAFATSNLKYPPPLPNNKIATPTINADHLAQPQAQLDSLSAVVDTPKIHLVDNQPETSVADHVEGSTTEAAESMQTKPSRASADTTAQKTMVLVLLSVLSGDR